MIVSGGASVRRVVDPPSAYFSAVRNFLKLRSIASAGASKRVDSSKAEADAVGLVLLFPA